MPIHSSVSSMAPVMLPSSVDFVDLSNFSSGSCIVFQSPDDCSAGVTSSIAPGHVFYVRNNGGGGLILDPSPDSIVFVDGEPLAPGQIAQLANPLSYGCIFCERGSFGASGCLFHLMGGFELRLNP